MRCLVTMAAVCGLFLPLPPPPHTSAEPAPLLTPELSWTCTADMEYTVHCSGCSRCYAAQQQQAAAEQRQQQQQQEARAGRWWSRFIPQPRPASPPPAGEPAAASAAPQPHGTLSSGVDGRSSRVPGHCVRCIIGTV